MANGSANISSVLALGGANGYLPSLVIPEANSQGYFTLYGSGTIGSAGVSPFYKNGVAYQVTAGKVCQVVAIMACTSAANNWFQLVSSTATFAPGGALTGGVYQFGASNVLSIVTGPLATYGTWSVVYSFAASTFPGWQNTASGSATYSIMLICKEV